MELIPILSLIILVATISTFVLAVGAYILYKIRERKGRVAKAPQPAAIPAEMIAPAPMGAEQKVTQQDIRRTYVDERYVTGEHAPEYQKQPIYATGQQNVPQQGPALRPTYIGNAPTRVTEERITGTHTTGETERFTGQRKFMRYTQEGYAPPQKQEKKKEEEGLRWR